MAKPLIKKKKNSSKKPSIEVVREIHLKKIMQSIESLSKAERAIYDKWDYRPDGEVVKHVKPRLATPEENAARKAKGLPPRIWRSDIHKGGKVV